MNKLFTKIEDHLRFGALSFALAASAVGMTAIASATPAHAAPVPSITVEGYGLNNNNFVVWIRGQNFAPNATVRVDVNNPSTGNSIFRLGNLILQRCPTTHLGDRPGKPGVLWPLLWLLGNDEDSWISVFHPAVSDFLAATPSEKPSELHGDD